MTRASSTHATTLAAILAAASRETSLLATALSLLLLDSYKIVSVVGVVLWLGRKPRCCWRLNCNSLCCSATVAAAAAAATTVVAASAAATSAAT